MLAVGPTHLSARQFTYIACSLAISLLLVRIPRLCRSQFSTPSFGHSPMLNTNASKKDQRAKATGKHLLAAVAENLGDGLNSAEPERWNSLGRFALGILN